MVAVSARSGTGRRTRPRRASRQQVPLDAAAVLQPVIGGQQPPGVLRAAEQVGRLLERLIVSERDDHHRLMTGPGDDYFLPVIHDSVESLGIMRTRLRVRHGLHRTAALRILPPFLTYRKLYATAFTGTRRDSPASRTRI